MIMPEARVAPPVSTREATRLAQALYGFDATAHPLPGEYDDNFHLVSSDSRQFVLKIMHPARERAFVDMQCRAFTHLALRAPHLSLPRVYPTAKSELFSETQLPDGTLRFIWLLTFLPGTVLAQTNPHSVELLESLGRLLAEIDIALLDFSHLFAKRDLKWDLTRSLWAREFLPHIKNTERRSLAANFLDLFEREALPHIPRLRRSVIYGDANDHNALVSPPWPQPRQVVSVIDFGDMHESITVAEPAIAAAYAILGHDNPLPAASAVLGAYHREHPLTDEEIAAFFPLLAARLAVSVINSAHRSSASPKFICDLRITLFAMPVVFRPSRMLRSSTTGWQRTRRPPRLSFRTICGKGTASRSTSASPARFCRRIPPNCPNPRCRNSCKRF
jgi:Ser/Thr protein kinase RdoA (MazF antagonist)